MYKNSTMYSYIKNNERVNTLNCYEIIEVEFIGLSRTTFTDYKVFAILFIIIMILFL